MATLDALPLHNPFLVTFNLVYVFAPIKFSSINPFFSNLIFF